MYRRLSRNELNIYFHQRMPVAKIVHFILRFNYIGFMQPASGNYVMYGLMKNWFSINQCSSLIAEHMLPGTLSPQIMKASCSLSVNQYIVLWFPRVDQLEVGSDSVSVRADIFKFRNFVWSGDMNGNIPPHNKCYMMHCNRIGKFPLFNRVVLMKPYPTFLRYMLWVLLSSIFALFFSCIFLESTFCISFPYHLSIFRASRFAAWRTNCVFIQKRRKDLAFISAFSAQAMRKESSELKSIQKETLGNVNISAQMNLINGDGMNVWRKFLGLGGKLHHVWYNDKNRVRLFLSLSVLTSIDAEAETSLHGIGSSSIYMWKESLQTFMWCLSEYRQCATSDVI